MKSAEFKISREEFEKLLKVIAELNKVSETHKIKIDSDGILIYSIVGEGQKINVLKTFYIKREKLFSQLNQDIKLIFTLIYGKNFEKRFKFLLDSEENEFDVVFNYDEENHVVYSFEMRNSILETRCTAGDDATIKDLDVATKKKIMNTDMSSYSFELSVEDLERVKKISKTEKDNDLISLKIDDGTLKLGESQWELTIAEDVEHENVVCSFQKKYLNSIVPAKDVIGVYLFPSYILVNEHKSQFLFSLELTG